MAKTDNLTHERLLQVLDYDPETGLFRWKMATSLACRIRAGDVAGSIGKYDGYLHIGIDGIVYRAHRLAFFYMTGRWPHPECDHYDLDRQNNRWENLREATKNQNASNRFVRSDSKSGLKGAFFHKKDGRWASKINVKGKYIWLGYFDTPEEAHSAYGEAAMKYNGEFARVK